jgi:glycosyltransferase involved in cell wall biosynthesis
MGPARLCSRVRSPTSTGPGSACKGRFAAPRERLTAPWPGRRIASSHVTRAAPNPVNPTRPAVPADPPSPVAPTVLTLVDYYLPGIKAGGPVRSIGHMVERLGDRYRFRVVTRDRDAGDSARYPGIEHAQWHPLGDARADVWYLPPGLRGLREMRDVLARTPHQVLYLNSLFSARMTFVALLLRRLRLVPPSAVVLAPRGELHPGALGTFAWHRWRAGVRGTGWLNPRYAKKRLYIGVCRALGLLRGVTWQASNPEEAVDIRRGIGEAARVAVAPDLGSDRLPAPGERTAKEKGTLRVAYVSRISPKKNLDGAIEMLAQAGGRITFDLYGPVEDAAYWRYCQAALERLAPDVEARYHGILPHVRVSEVLRRHDLLLLPTWGENFGHVILEALVAGCPVLISDQTPWRGLEAQGVGWDLPLADPAAFAAVLGRCREMDAGEHAEWSARAAAYGRRGSLDEHGLALNGDLFDAALRGAQEFLAAGQPRGHRGAPRGAKSGQHAR